MSRPTSVFFRSFDLPTSLRIALRELRKPGTGIAILCATLVFATTILVLSVSLTQSVRDGLRQSAQQTIGGDISLRLFHRTPSHEEISFLETLGTVGISIEQRVMVGPSNDQPPVLSELKAVDQAYPLYGNLTLSSNIALEDALAVKDGTPGVVVGPELLEETGLGIGDHLELAGQIYQVRASITAEPERTFRLFSLGPRVIVGLTAYRDNPLLAPGKQVYWYFRLKLPSGSNQTPEQIIAAIEDRFPDSGWRIVNAADGVPGLERIGDFASAFVSLMGIAIFAIATSAIQNALRADLGARRSRFATLRSLGARPRDIGWSLIWQLGMITGAAILIAAVLTVTLGMVIGPILSGSLGFAVRPVFSAGLMIVAFVFGFVALVAIKPVSDACQTSPACLFRHQTANSVASRSKGLKLLKVVLAIGLLAIAGALIDLGWFTFVVLGLLIACQGLFVLLGRAIQMLAGRLATKHLFAPSLRLALRNIARPTAPTVTITASFGLAMTCLCAVLLFGALAGHHLKSVLPSETPDVVFFDIPPAEQNAFLANAQGHDAVKTATQMPFLHGRVTHLNGVPLTRADVPRRYHWFLRGDRGMSWTDQPTGDMRENPIIEGQWWAADSVNQNLVSLDAGVAGAVGMSLGDQLTLNIMGQSYEVTVANLRQIDWTRLGLDFPIVLSPMEPVFDHGVISALNVKDGVQPQTAVAPLLEAYPAIPVIFVNEVLAKLTRLFEGVVTALIGLTALATVGSILVIVCGLIALRQQQTEILAMLRALGLRPNQINRTGALETGLMVAIGGLVGVLTGSAIAIGAAQAIGSINLVEIAQIAGPMALVTFGLVLVVGFAGGWMLQASSLRTQTGWRG